MAVGNDGIQPHFGADFSLASAVERPRLRAGFGKTVRVDAGHHGMGVAANGKLMQLFASPPPESTWTITVTTASGVMCMVASGDNYEELSNPALAPQGDPA